MVSGYIRTKFANTALFEEHIIVICLKYYFSSRLVDLLYGQIGDTICQDEVSDAAHYKELGDIFVDENKGGIKLI